MLASAPGTCNRNGTAVGSPDPEWGGIVDPAAGAWFTQQALQLAQLANPLETFGGG